MFDRPDTLECIVVWLSTQHSALNSPHCKFSYSKKSKRKNGEKVQIMFSLFRGRLNLRIRGLEKLYSFQKIFITCDEWKNVQNESIVFVSLFDSGGHSFRSFVQNLFGRIRVPCKKRIEHFFSSGGIVCLDDDCYYFGIWNVTVP